jgi:ketosteroid isomerase-like protein
MIPAGGFLRDIRCARSGRATWRCTMKIVSAVLAALLLASTGVFADDRAAVEDLLARYDRAYLAADTKAVGAVLAEDYRAIVDGQTKDRAAALAELADPKREFRPTAVSSTLERVHVSGDLAVAVGRIAWKSAKGEGAELYTLVLRREGGAWRAVEEHISEAKPDPAG